MREQVEDLEARREGSGYLFQKSVGEKKKKKVCRWKEFEACVD